jgi:phosphoribosylformylglycinamidine cyclo-ligase
MIQSLRKNVGPQVSLVHDHYRDAGVDTDEADAGLQKLTSRITTTWPPTNTFGAVQLDIGYFANVIDICGQGIAISTDGIGSKAMIATMMHKYDTVGIDCVAMNVNDVVCVGAKPVSMVDYIAIEKVDQRVLDEIGIGLCVGAKIAGISISGGETAQLKDMISGFDLAGTAIGHVALDKVLVGQNLQEGDVLLGIESNGIHSNGLSLARRAFFETNKYKPSHNFDELKHDLGTELLRPTHIYVREALGLLESVPSTKALVHITSDGFLNLTRVKADVGFVIDSLPPIPPIFSIIQRLDKINDTEMFVVFNMGIGFCVVVSPQDVELAMSVISRYKKKVHRIGYVVTEPRRQVIIEQHNLIGRGKHFKKRR